MMSRRRCRTCNLADRLELLVVVVVRIRQDLGSWRRTPGSSLGKGFHEGLVAGNVGSSVA